MGKKKNLKRNPKSLYTIGHTYSTRANLKPNKKMKSIKCKDFGCPASQHMLHCTTYELIWRGRGSLNQHIHCATRKKGSLISEFQISLLISVESRSILIENWYQPFYCTLIKGRERGRDFMYMLQNRKLHIWTTALCTKYISYCNIRNSLVWKT